MSNETNEVLDRIVDAVERFTGSSAEMWKSFKMVPSSDGTFHVTVTWKDGSSTHKVVDEDTPTFEVGMF